MKEEEIKKIAEAARKLPKHIGNPLFDGLSAYVKDPKNFFEIQKSIIDTVQTKCTHGDIMEFAKCKICTAKMLERRKLLKKYGFKNAKQYFEWRRVHQEIRRQFPLMDWATGKQIAG